MADLTNYRVTDLIDTILATQYNRVIDSVVRGELENTETLAANKTLVDADFALQVLNPTAARAVTLPAVAAGNHPFYVVNVSATYALTVKNAVGTVIGSVPPMSVGIFASNGTTWYALTNANRGYISENAAQLLYVGANAYSVLPGAADVNGLYLTWSANIARTSVSLAADTLYYVYLYDNSGVAAVEESTTAPVWDSVLNYYKKTGDATRRCIGFIQANATAAIRNFYNTVSGRSSEFIYSDGSVTGKAPVASGTATTWTSFSLAPLVPAHATHAQLLLKMIGTTLGDDGIIGISQIDLGGAIAANLGPYTVRARASAAGASVYFGNNWLPIATSQTLYYCQTVVSGTPATTIQITGSRIIR